MRLINGREVTDGTHRMAFMRTKQNGWPDTSFGTNGTLIVTTANDKYGSLSKMTDGSFMTVNVFDNDPAPFFEKWGLNISKFNSDYTVNTSFGTNGTKKHFFDFPGELNPTLIHFYPDGRFLIGATTETNPYNANTYGIDYDATFFRFLPNGNLDPSFGVNGIFTMNFGSNLEEGLYSLIFTPSADIYGLGFSEYTNFQGDRRGLVVKILQNGMLDSSWGNLGRYINPDIEEMFTGIVLKDSKLLVAGYPGYTICRITADGFPDSEFGVNGTAKSYFTSGGGFPFHMIKPNDSVVVVTGNAFAGNQGNNITTARYKLGFQPLVTGIRSRYCLGATATGTIINMPAVDTTVTVLVDNVSISVSPAGVFTFPTGVTGQHTVEVRFTKGAATWKQFIYYTVMTFQSISITTPDQKLCKDGNSITVLANAIAYWSGNGIDGSADGAFGYTGFNPAGLSGTQMIIATRDNGPCGLAKDTVIFTLVQLAPVITANGNLLSTPLVTGVIYTWYRNGVQISGANTNQYLATQSGSYMVTERLANCTKTSAAFIFTITAVGNPITNNVISVFPNPASSVINLKGLNQNRRYEYSIISFDGRIILSELPLKFPFRINIENLSSGVYYIAVREKGTHLPSINYKFTLIR
jgi:hypothetical protein